MTHLRRLMDRLAGYLQRNVLVQNKPANRAHPGAVSIDWHSVTVAFSSTMNLLELARFWNPLK
ncbi:MAG: hypothetical protein DWH91_04750 [Planctomycetota bacterium]|nr:MAG: hypothetical protein DWH91_04750 [Planctomycetota bacterium]